jgi:hypothetical protein
MQTPFSVAPYNVVDFSNALYNIQGDIDTVQPLIEKFRRSNSPDDEARMLLAMSSLEIKMTNFANDMRRKLA